MNIRKSAAILAAKLVSTACKLTGRQGVTLPGQVAMKLYPNILKDLASQVRGPIFVVCGTNGKTSTNNMLCTVFESQGKRVVCNHTGANMLYGVAAAFVLGANMSGRLDADVACIEIDEASTVKVFPYFLPDCMVLTNLFRDQLDRYGEIDTTMSLLDRAIKMAPSMKLIINGDDPLLAYLAGSNSNETITYGIPNPVSRPSTVSHEIREGIFCKSCGHKLDYDFYHYSQMGSYHCPSCGFSRPALQLTASNISTAQGLRFSINGNPIHSQARGFYNIYNILACRAAADLAGLDPARFEETLAKYNPHNGRNEAFSVRGNKVLLNLAKNPTGFNQNIASVMEDPSPKDLIIVINDNAQDGTDVSWLWDVDFDLFADPSIRSITVSGIRCQDMRLRLKYVDIASDLIPDVREAIVDRLEKGCGNLYVLVNYTALYSTHQILTEMEDKS